MRTEIIGIDIGNGYIKTENCMVRTGIRPAAHHPSEEYAEWLTYGDKSYAVGAVRDPIRPDRLETNDLFHMVNAVIGIELYRRDVHPEELTSVEIATGLPPHRLEQLRTPLRRYLMRDATRLYGVNNCQIHIHVEHVAIYPQNVCVAARRLDDKESLQTSHVVDIGASAVAVQSFQSGHVLFGTTHSYEDFGLIRMFASVRDAVERETGVKLRKEEVEDILNSVGGNRRVRDAVFGAARRWMEHMIFFLMEEGYCIDREPVDYIGGGALLLKGLLNADHEELFQTANFHPDIREQAIAFQEQRREDLRKLQPVKPAGKKSKSASK